MNTTRLTAARNRATEDTTCRKITSGEGRYEDLNDILPDLLNDESGQDLIEYALVVCIIALGAVATMTTFAGTIRTVLGSIGTKLTSAV
jgi:pilus assembly protein Flp/PilA